MKQQVHEALPTLWEEFDCETNIARLEIQSVNIHRFGYFCLPDFYLSTNFEYHLRKFLSRWQIQKF